MFEEAFGLALWCYLVHINASSYLPAGGAILGILDPAAMKPLTGLIVTVCLAFSNGAEARDFPLGLPSMPSSAADPRLVALGRELFFDKHLSADALVSCATCHRPDAFFTDRRPVALGVRRRAGTRNTPSLLNIAYSPTLFWDGRADSLESQVRLPLLNPREHGLPSEAAVLAAVGANPSYVRQLRELLGREGFSVADIARALASYERTLLSGNSPADRYLYGGQTRALSAAAQRGLALFRGRAGCAACHLIGADSALFTDNLFHSSPIPLPQSTVARLQELTRRVLASRSRYGFDELNRVLLQDGDIAALGHFVVTLDPKDIGAFKTPSLRNVARTAPYFHDGSVNTLSDALEVELYDRGGVARSPISLSADERNDLLEFLYALSSG